MTSYVFDNAWQQARQRLTHLEQSLDPATFRRLEALSIADGWQCLDVGAGGGSVARWLCSQVGATGRVVATDMDTRFLEALAEPNLEVRQHNLISDELPERRFDLIHSRMVLMHIPSREEILPRLASALKPGGWLLLEEQDIGSLLAMASGSYRRVWEAFVQCVEAAGVKPEWGRQLPQLLAQEGLTEVGAEGDMAIFAGASPMANFWSLTWEQARERIVPGLERGEILDDALAMLRKPAEWFYGPITIAAWGRRPE